MTTGLLLFAHGARDPQWARPFQAIVQHITAAQPHLPVALAYLEFMSPTLEQAGESLVQGGCTRVLILPLFLGAGGHVRKDLPALLSLLQARYCTVDWQLQPAIGEMPSIVQAMAEAALACTTESHKI
jgi:sirohydrochlorin cobaltochelatase